MSTIMWIEDDHSEMPALVGVLEKAGHDIPRYRTYTEVIDRLEEVCQCDAVILDVILPPINDNPYNGVIVLKKLREHCEKNIPVVVCTVVRNPAIIETLYKLGVSEILHKPVRPTKLAEAVTRAIQNQQ